MQALRSSNGASANVLGTCVVSNTSESVYRVLDRLVARSIVFVVVVVVSRVTRGNGQESVLLSEREKGRRGGKKHEQGVVECKVEEIPVQYQMQVFSQYWGRGDRGCRVAGPVSAPSTAWSQPRGVDVVGNGSGPPKKPGGGQLRQRVRTFPKFSPSIIEIAVALCALDLQGTGVAKRPLSAVDHLGRTGVGILGWELQGPQAGGPDQSSCPLACPIFSFFSGLSISMSVRTSGALHDEQHDEPNSPTLLRAFFPSKTSNSLHASTKRYV